MNHAPSREVLERRKLTAPGMRAGISKKAMCQDPNQSCSQPRLLSMNPVTSPILFSWAQSNDSGHWIITFSFCLNRGKIGLFKLQVGIRDLKVSQCCYQPNPSPCPSNHSALGISLPKDDSSSDHLVK